MEGQESNALRIKHQSKWMRFLRVIIWVTALLLLSVGIVVLQAGMSSEAVTNATDKALLVWGKVFLVSSLVIFGGNFVWGVARWAEKWNVRKWKVWGGIVRTVWAGVWRSVVFSVIFMVGILAVAPKIEQKITHSVLSDRETNWLKGLVGIREDFRQGNISPDEYLQYTIAAAYGQEDLPEKYRSDKVEMAPDILGIIDQYGEQMSPEVIREALEVVTLANVEFGEDANGNVATNRENVMDAILGTKRAQAYSRNVATLNKAKLSSGGKFVIFYTDTGDDAISDEKASELAEMMERIVRQYQEKMGLEYSYEFFSMEGLLSNSKRLMSMIYVLEKNGIDGDVVTNGAMPVYVVNPFKEESSILAFYTRRKITETLYKVVSKLGALFLDGDEADQAKLTNSVPGVPFVTILPKNVNDASLELVTAHELGHHYEDLKCYTDGDDTCASGDFIMETAANWMAINAVGTQPENTLIQAYHNNYIDYGTCYMINQVLPDPPEYDACHGSGSLAGYPAVAFLENYAEVVAGGQDKIMAALLHEETLEYLWSQATIEERTEIMCRLSQRNLTNDYKQNSLVALKTPRGEELKCEGQLACRKVFPLRTTATKYVYFSADEYDQTKVSVTGEPNMVISVLGRKSDGKWEVIADDMTRIENDKVKLEWIVEKEGNYDMYAFAVGNAKMIATNLTTSDPFVVETVVQEIEDKVEDEEESTDVSQTEDGCTVLEFAELWDGLSSIGQATFDGLEMLGAEVGDDRNGFNQNIAEVKMNTDGRKLIACEVKMKSGVTLSEVEQMVRRRLWWSAGGKEMGEVGEKVKILVGIDKAKKQGKVFLLGEESDKVYVLEMRVE